MWWIKKKQKINIENLGVIPDPRTPREKKQDYQAEEILKFVAIKWKEIPESQWRKYPVFNQDYSSSCLAQGTAKALGIENFLEERKFIHSSARDIYTRRANYPGEGMYFMDAMNIARKFGATIEQLMPSQGLNESLMNDFSDRTPLTEIIAKVGRGGNNIVLPISIDQIASVIEPEGKPVILGVRFGPNEWFGKKVPEILGTDTRYAHGICATNAVLYQGKKSLIIEDSAYYDAQKEAVRVLTEDWFKANRIIWAGYFEFLKNESQEGIKPKPKFNFERNLFFGLTNDPDVKKLQECLSWLGMFPKDVEFTGNFMGLTLKSVELFQMHYKEKISEYLNYQIKCTGFVGKGTRYTLNEIFNP
jgi:hypothetical protein